MLGSMVIVFREVLEAAILIGIIAAATKSIPGRSRWLAGGVGAGLVGAVLVAVFADVIGNMASGLGQEVFNATVLGIAVLMLAWHNIWMSSHGAALAADAKAVGGAIREGRQECSVLLVVVGLAVLREGAETVLFLYGIAASGGASGGAGDTGGASGASMMLGGISGLFLGVAVGYALYAGLLRIPLRWFFAATGLLVLLLAAGMASQAAHFLIQADMLPSLAAPLWDTSAYVAETSVPGMLLRGLIGYDARPAGMQLIFYVITLVTIAAGMKWVGRRPVARVASPRAG
jgi:high-affinity iron transporter